GGGHRNHGGQDPRKSGSGTRGGTGGGGDVVVHHSRSPLFGGRSPDHEFPSAPVEPGGDGGRLPRTAVARRLHDRIGAEIPVPQLRGRHAGRSLRPEVAVTHAASWTGTGQDGSARTGTLTLTHGTVATPAFMPVGTRAALRAVDVHDP